MLRWQFVNNFFGFNRIENEAKSYVINVLLIIFLCHVVINQVECFVDVQENS